MEFLWFILIGLIAGSLAGLFLKCNSCGIIGDIIARMLGALIGGFLLRFFGDNINWGVFGPILVATTGAVILILTLRFVNKSSV